MGKLSGLRRMQRRLGVREELIAGVVLAVLAIGGFAFTLATQVGTPAGAALAYLAAVDRGDVSYVWTHSVVEQTSSPGLSQILTARSAMVAQLSAFAHTRSRVIVKGVGYEGVNSRVTLSYGTSAGLELIDIVLRGETPHAWLVDLQPTGLEIALPTGAGVLAIDGQRIEATAGSRFKVAVLPGHHRITLAGSHLYQDYGADVRAEIPLPAVTPVTFTDVHLTAAGTAETMQAVRDAFKSCAASRELTPAGCPQSLPEVDVANGDATWRLVSDPTTVFVGLDANSTLEVIGHFLMSLDYDSRYYRRERLLGVGGPYVADLSSAAQGLKLSLFTDASYVSDLGRAPATDDQVVASLKAQFDVCVKLQAGEAAGCPQTVVALYGSGFLWREDGDPLQAAIVGWDGKQGLFTVAGNFTLSVDYTSTPPYGPPRKIHDSSSGQYVADLYWDGSKVAFIGFEK